MRTILGFFLCLHLVLTAGEWKTDYKEALAASQESHKPLLLAFLGAEWCPWSQKIQSEVLSQPQFYQELDSFILLRMDVAQFAKSDEPVSLLKEKYQIQEMPSFVLVSPAGEEMATVGYMPLSPAEFAALFKDIKAGYEEIAQADLLSLEGHKLQEFYMTALKYGFNKFRYEILAQGLQVDQSPFFLLEKYKLLMESGKGKGKDAASVKKELLKRDPKNIYGVHRTLAILEFHKLSNRYRLRKKPDQVVKPLIDYVKKFGEKDQEHLWKIEMMIAQFYFSRDVVQLAIKHAEASLRDAPLEAKSEIAQSIDFLKTKL